ncbi:MAG: hypothetical protein HUJ56_00990 [Erysipelotrichaceae bacterium]|nr:hypothetical protein [Erysipelotrichaceae bacterium]
MWGSIVIILEYPLLHRHFYVEFSSSWSLEKNLKVFEGMHPEYFEEYKSPRFLYEKNSGQPLVVHKDLLFNRCYDYMLIMVY